MKVCIFTETYFPEMGGGETQAQLLANGLIAGGHSVIVLTRRSNRAFQRVERYGELTVHRLSPSGAGQLKKWGLLLSAIPALFRLRREYDLVFVSGYRIVGAAAVLVCRFLGKGCVLKADSQGEMSGAFFESGLNRFGISRASVLFRLFLSLRNRLLRKADAFAAISPEIADEISLGGVPATRIHRIPNAVDTVRFHPVDAAGKVSQRLKLGIDASAYVAVYTGRLVSYKGLPLLLSVWNEISRKVPDALLLLVGTGGLDIHNCEQDLKDYVRDHDLEKHVRFTGSVPNVHEFLQASDLFVFPTRNDAFPSSLIEAMASGLPVIATPVGAITTIVSDGENGMLIPVGDPLSLSKAIEGLWMEPDLATHLAANAIKSVTENYTAEIVTRQYSRLFESVI